MPSKATTLLAFEAKLPRAVDEGWSIEQMADEMHCSPMTVAKLMRREVEQVRGQGFRAIADYRDQAANVIHDHFSYDLNDLTAWGELRRAGKKIDRSEKADYEKAYARVMKLVMMMNSGRNVNLVQNQACCRILNDADSPTSF